MSYRRSGRSLREAQAFTRSLYADDVWDEPTVASFINRQRNATMAAVPAAGQPHASVVVAACLGDQVHFRVAPPSLLGRCLERDRSVAFTVCDARHAAMGRGAAVLAARSLDDPGLIERLARATDVGTFTPPDWDGLIYRINIDRIFAN